MDRDRPDDYERLQEAERQKEQLKREIASCKLQLEAAAARKVEAAAKERDETLQDLQNLRKELLLERLFVDADGRAGGDNRGSFFEIFKHQVGVSSASPRTAPPVTCWSRSTPRAMCCSGITATSTLLTTSSRSAPIRCGGRRPVESPVTFRL